MAVKVTKGQIHDGTISKNNMSQGAQFVWKVLELYHKTHEMLIFGAMPLY